jgi:hypothetical protein
VFGLVERVRFAEAVALATPVGEYLAELAMKMSGKARGSGSFSWNRAPIAQTITILSIALSLWGVRSAGASFHLAEIDELMVGYGGDADAQFVEIEMLAGGQNLVAGSKLTAFEASGAFSSVVLNVSGNVQSGSARRWLMATSEFVALSGVAADFVFVAGLPASGMVCWGKPVNQQNPADYIDCVSYGSYSGPANVHTAAPNPLSPIGFSLRRVAHTNDSSFDFSCSDTADPENNAGATTDLAATAPCMSTSTTSTTSTLPTHGDCGDGTDDGDVTASDALLALRTAVGVLACELCRCDVDGSGGVAASDALRILNAAVGVPVALDCPLCAGSAR